MKRSQYFRFFLAEERPSLQSLDRSRNESWRFLRVGPGQVGGPLPNAALGASHVLCVSLTIQATFWGSFEHVLRMVWMLLHVPKAYATLSCVC